jgi:hypothetical protein
MDGFDAGDFPVKWNSYNGGTASATTTRFGSGRSMSISNYFWNLRKLLPATVAEMYVGWAMYTAAGGSAGSDTYISLLGDDGGALHLKLMLNSASTLRVVRGDNTVLATSAPGTFLTNQWNYIEMRATISDAGGRCVVRVNGVDIIDFTGDTKNGGTATQFDTIILGDIGTNTGPRATTYFDDFYVCDATGTTNNTFLGDIRIQTLTPVAAGNYTQFTPTGSANNWDTVNELPYSTADYSSASTVGQKDSYTMSDVLGTTGAIKGIQTNIIANKSDAGNATARSFVRVGSTDYADLTRGLTTSTITYTSPRDINPATSAAWTASDVNGLESGIEIV